MLKYCINKWYENKDKLEQAIRKDETLTDCEYEAIVKLIVKYILNPSSSKEFDEDSITVIDNGDYQGCQLFMIPKKTYEPYAGDYLLTYIDYGSCSGCDTLQWIQQKSWEKKSKLLSESQIKDLMILCKDLVCNMTKPYNKGYFEDEDFMEIAE